MNPQNARGLPTSCDNRDGTKPQPDISGLRMNEACPRCSHPAMLHAMDPDGGTISCGLCETNAWVMSRFR